MAGLLSTVEIPAVDIVAASTGPGEEIGQLDVCGGGGGGLGIGERVGDGRSAAQKSGFERFEEGRCVFRVVMHLVPQVQDSMVKGSGEKYIGRPSR
jgi:hypothetical protein